jgi:hypothetical protein
MPHRGGIHEGAPAVIKFVDARRRRGAGPVAFAGVRPGVSIADLQSKGRGGLCGAKFFERRPAKTVFFGKSMISLNEFDLPDDESEPLSEEQRAMVEKDDVDDWGPGGFAAVWGKVFREALGRFD